MSIAGHAAMMTFSPCTYLIVKHWSHVSPLLSPLFSASQAHVRVYSCAWSDAVIHKRDPGPLHMDDEAGSCLTQLRSTQWAVKAYHLHTLLQSIPHSLLTECVSATHSSFTLGLNQKKPQTNKVRESKESMFVLWVSFFSLLTSCLQNMSKNNSEWSG